MKKAVFLDKDGTLIKNIPYNVNPDFIEFLPHVIPGLQLLSAANYQLVIVTNQSGVAKGYFQEKDLDKVEEKIRKEMSHYEVGLSGFYFCPHHPEGIVPKYTRSCLCRKPMPGLILEAAKDLGSDLSLSWTVGDIPDDIEAGRLAGTKTALVNFSGQNFVEIAKKIINQTRESKYYQFNFRQT
ncbi:MAG: D,D-heptose 1,7-bisphosphate phosphatase [Candidatus Gottesmanbacteria bacterium GW2011_GWC2_39_8]|uniref:D,D-heptose 1,7-bisphosphate phosphatase n=1 Tax=Candidatus Gottesmanbacteria bacterium GW2011_GWC2_39_8 TaxID=1618450 RepID=A0A0G0Q934_9BACT|nr:MAG: D,D-heptose 1,7-bisphosphate phosphatase [Candidatus Gottesmanbacteria bacterium GW2011_GWC2_39_8]